MKYSVEKIPGCVLHKLWEKRKVKGRMVWVCIGILTGKVNAKRVEGRLNRG